MRRNAIQLRIPLKSGKAAHSRFAGPLVPLRPNTGPVTPAEFHPDQAFAGTNRIFDTVSEHLVRAWFEGRLTDEQKADFVRMLETMYERGQWDGDVDKLAARANGAPVVQLEPEVVA